MANHVAVIVRTKDRSYFLGRALADIAAQTYDDLEVVVVNDGGDLTKVNAVVDKSTISSRVRVLGTEAPGGRCAAANAGLRATEADYVVLHDDDDRWHPDFLARTVARLDENDTDAGVMVATDIVLEKRQGDRWVEFDRHHFWEGMTEITFTNLLEVNRAVPISFLYRRSLHDELGFYDETLETVEDWDFYLRIAAKHPIAFIPGKALAYWTQRPSAKAADANSMFGLADQHLRDDLAVRDAALREWVADNGQGLPLYLALLERRMREDFTRQLDEQRAKIVADLRFGRPMWSGLRRIGARVARRLK